MTDLSAPVTVVLVRHGETDGNTARVIQTPETPLSARGMAQAERVAQRLAGIGGARLVSSDLLRARMTAEAIGARLGISVETQPLLQEQNFGQLRGTAYDDLPGNPRSPDFFPPDGENLEMFHARVAAAFAWIVAEARACAGNLILVSHGLFCRALVGRHLPETGAPTPDHFQNTSVTLFDAAPPHALRLVNCVAHLDVLT
jgi:probable phosphoglycerate mutase